MAKDIAIIGAPMDLGQTRRGVDMGPSAIRYAGVVDRLQKSGHSIEDYGDITIKHPSELNTQESSHLKNLDEIVTANQSLFKKVDNVMSNDRFPLILGGDHSIGIGALAGAMKHNENLGVIWYDAHPDMNTDETSPSGNIHGMPLAVGLGCGHSKLTGIGGSSLHLNPENVVVIGARSIDEGEKSLIREKGVRVYTMHEIDRLGMSAVMGDAIDYLGKRTNSIHLSLDLDGLDPLVTPGVGTPVIGGLSYRESHLAMEMLAKTNLVTSAEFVEVNPILDDKNKTADVAVGLMGSLFGEALL